VLAGLGYAVARRLEFELDLLCLEDDLWERLEYKRRKNIKKGARMGVVLHDPSAAEGVPHLRRLQAESAQRIVQRGGRDITYRGRHLRDPAEVLVESGLGRIVVAEVAGEIVSAGLFTCFNGLVYHTLSGHSRKALETQAPTFLLWETIKRYKREGARRFNFGGCSAEAVNEGSPEHGIYIYKMGFGGTCLECASGSKVLRKAAHRTMGLLRSLLRQ
ncbi:MAG: peptidoglycan bridge formation glycyltransferase FemA/FemB family protein, partial [Spirochaetes bacterium]|nr:peptidoglycan bridge formation glycyltransferase FemA/FemB family protein [Spirochaetota bacterium]